MKKKSLVLTLLVTSLSFLSSCSLTKDPTKEFILEAQDYYNKYLSSNPEGDKHIYYYDGSSTRCIVFSPSEDKEYEYLGLLNFSTLRFSNSKDYIFDLGNIKLNIETNDDDTLSFTIPEYMDENNNISVSKILETPPFVLIKNDGENKTIFSGITKEGKIIDSANASTYDSTFYYLEDFKYKVNDYISFDYSNKMLAILRRDIIEYISLELKDMSLPSFLDFSKALLTNYRKVNNLSSSEEMPSTLHIKGKVNDKEVVVGPMGFSPIFGKTLEDNSKVNFLSYVDTLYIDEGVTELTFFALNNSTNLKNLYLPSTLKECSISSLSNLNLDNLYVANTTNNIKFTDLGVGDMPGYDDIDFTPALYNTKINNSLVFEDYSNINLINFPYSSITIDENKELKDIIKISKDKEIVTYNSLEEAFTDFNNISLQYEFDLSKNKEVHTGNVTEIKENQTLFIDQSKKDIYSTSDAYKRCSNTTYLVDNNNYSSCLILDSDLVVNGNIIIGANIGQNDTFSGVINGEYGAIDLNGHNLIINNGKVSAYGLIFDSKLSEDSTNGIIVKKSGELITNLGIEGYYCSKNAFSRLNNNACSYELYTLKDIRCNFKVEQNGTLTTYTRFFDNYNQEFKNTYIGNDGYIDNSSSDVTRTYNNGKEIYSATSIVINPINISSSLTSKDIYYPVVNKYISFNIEDTLTLNQNMVIYPDGYLYVSNLILNKNIFILSNKSYTLYPYYLDIVGNKEGSISISSSLTLSNLNLGIYGDINTTNEAYESIKNTLFNNTNKKLTYTDGCISSDLKAYETVIEETKNIKIICDNYYCYTDNNSTYYEIDNTKTNTGYLKKISDNSILASYINSLYWTAYVDSKAINTNVINSSKIDTFSVDSEVYSLLDGNWVTSLKENSDHTYTINKLTYIKVDGTLINGTYNYNIFKTNDSSYIYDDSTSSWNEVRFFENNRIIQDSETLSYYYFLSSSSKYVSCSSYDAKTHSFINNGKTYVYLKNSNTIKECSGSIKDDSDGSTLIYFTDTGWNEGKVYSSGKAYVDYKYYYYIDNLKWVEANNFLSNSNSDYEFIYFNDNYTYQDQEYKYALNEKDESNSTRYTNKVSFFSLDIDYSKVDITKDNCSEIWDSVLTQVPSEYQSIINNTSSFTIYRHIKESDGKNYLFYKDSNGNISKKCFTFASGFIPSEASGGNNILTKFNFLKYNVIFEGESEVKTIYMGVDDVVGGFIDTDNYLALTVFQDESPVNDLLKSI